MKNLKIFALTLLMCVKIVFPVPISVPIDNSYPLSPSYNSHQNFYDDNTSARRPNSYYNRLPTYGNQAQVDDVAGIGSNNDDDYDDQQTDKPVISSSNQQTSNYNNLYNNNYLLTENRVKFKKKRRVRRPCIPIQSFGSQLFSNRLKREVNYDAESGKTLNYLFGGFNNNYRPPYYQSQSQFVSQYADNVNPQYDNPGSSQVQYQPSSGYPCVPVSFGHKPGGGGGLFGGSGLFGGGGGGPLSSFLGQGQGGLFDFNSPGPLSPSGIYQGSGNYPQTVIINRPPLFSPNFGSSSSNNGGNRPGTYPQDSSTSGSSNQPGFWGTVVDKLQEFVRIISR